MPGGSAILNKQVQEDLSKVKASVEQRLEGGSGPGARGRGTAPRVFRAEAGHQFLPQVLALTEWPWPVVTPPPSILPPVQCYPHPSPQFPHRPLANSLN